MQTNNTPTTGNAESPRITEDGTPNYQPPLTVENSTPNVDYTDALSEATGQQPPGTSFASTPITVPTYMAVLYYLVPTQMCHYHRYPQD